MKKDIQHNATCKNILVMVSHKHSYGELILGCKLRDRVEE